MPERIVLVQQGAWATPRESMPLAVGYLKAAALASPRLAGQVDVDIVNFRGGEDVRSMARRLASGGAPDVLAFSVLGWNFRTFGELASTYRQVRPDGLIVFGGNHVTNQAERVFRLFPDVDIVVNGEGERTFEELLHWRLAGRRAEELDGIAGISFRRGDSVVTTDARPRIDHLDEIASPFLTGAIPMTDEHGRFPYDVALMETNRGCPYKCAFCYWGGAIGTKVREFDRRRLRAELEHVARHGAETVVLCDANFGMRRADLEFVHDFLAVREEHGYPRYLESSWTKNKSETFYEIISLMRREGVLGSVTLALQTLDDPALRGMNRRNMQINEWHEVVEWLADEGVSCYAELIWGAPGETRESFFDGYDRLATRVPRIAVYPLLIIPNTAYDAERDQHGMVTVRGDDDDYEYVLSHRTMSVEDNFDVQGFMFWARLLAEHPYFRWVWHGLRQVAGISQSAAIRSVGEFVVDAAHGGDRTADAIAQHCRPFADSTSVVRALRSLYGLAEVDELMRRWWYEVVLPATPPALVDFMIEVFEYDALTRPVYVRPDAEAPLPVEHGHGESWYLREPVALTFDVPATLAGTDVVDEASVVRRPREVAVRSKIGFFEDVENHEIAVHYLGREGERA